MLLTGWGIWWLLTAALSANYFVWYPIIPAFFYLMGIVLVLVLTRDKKESQLKLVNLYMILKFSKVAACLILVGSYLIFEKEHLRDFCIVFIGFYLLYLGIETYFFYKSEEVLKKNKVNE